MNGSPMKSTDDDTRRYLRDLQLALQLREVDGARIGEVLAEVEAHVAESGEPAATAFGPARTYAQAFTPMPRSRAAQLRVVVLALVSAVGGVGVGLGFFALFTGGTVLGMPGWLALALGLVVMVGAIRLTGSNRVVDPRLGRPFGLSDNRLMLVMFAAVAAVALLCWGGFQLFS